MWEIKGKDNTAKAIIEAVEYDGKWMEQTYVTATIESPEPINFEIGDYLIYRDERFEINYDPGKIKSAPRYEKGDAFKYENVKFNSLADELTRCDFLDVVLNDNQLHFTGLPKFSFYGNVQDLANRMQANLDKTYGKNTWRVEVSPEYTDRTEINVRVDSPMKVQGALSILVNDFKAYYTIKGRTLTIGAAGVPAGHLFKYGEGNGLYEIEQNAEADQAIVTRVRAYGSTRNLPHRYYNSLTGADGQKLIPDNMAVQNLMLPSFPYTTQDPYVDSPNIAKLGIREDTIFFDGSMEGLPEIYPSIEGMTAEQLKAAGVSCNATGALDEIVSAEQMTDNGVGEINEGETQTTAKPPTFKITLKDLGFNINDHLTTETATVSFKSGMLGGRDFEIVDCKKEGDNYVLELNRVYDDGIKLWFPYKDYNAKAGDKFVLLHIGMPDVYIKAQSQYMLEKTEEWLSKNDYSRSIYAPKIDENFMARQHDEAMASGGTIKSLHDTLKEGMLLLFEDEDLNIDASIFIDSLTIKEGDGPIPTYEVVLKEEKTVGRLDKMQNQIDSLAAGKGQGSGYTAAQIRQMIDAYGSSRFLSKLKDDRSAGQIASDIAFEVGNFLAGVSGAKIGVDKETGQTFGEMDKLFIRVKAYFDTLTIINAESLAGEQRITPGGGVKCTSVEETDTAYRCYFLSEQDGEKTETKIIVGDQAISQMFNAKTDTSNKVSNHRYWRLVTGVSNDAYTDDSGNRYGYIDLSKTDCEERSDVPQAGDVIVQFGNRNDRSRQAAMVFSTVDVDAPSIKLLTGIDSYSLAGKDIISYGYDTVKGNAYFNCYGDTYIGDPKGATFIKYDQATKQLDIKARLSLYSTIGDKTLGEIAEGVDAGAYLREALPQDTNISGGMMLSTLLSLGYTDEAGLRHTLAGLNGAWVPSLGGRTIAAWWGGEPADRFGADGSALSPMPDNAATSLIRMDGSGYLAGGNVLWNTDGSGSVAGGKLWWDHEGNVTIGAGVTIRSGEDGMSATLAQILNFTNRFNSMFERVEEAGAPGGWYIRAKASVVTGGELVAGARWDGSGGSASWGLSLGALTDVSVGDASEGQYLRYVGGRWVASDGGGGGGIDQSALESYLTDNGYATQSWVTGRLGNFIYWEKHSVGTANNTNLPPMMINIEADTLINGYGDYWTVLNLGSYSGGHFRSQIAMPYRDSIADTDMFIRTGLGANSWRPWRRVLHDGNYASVLDGRYVNVSGDTMTGRLNINTSGKTLTIGSTNATWAHYVTDANWGHWFNKSVYVQGEIYAGGSYDKIVWHAGNDGSGSGLDADTLDGVHNGNVVALYHRAEWIADLNNPHFYSHGLSLDYFDGSAANKPLSYDNANAVLNISHGTHGTNGHYGAQICFVDASRLTYRIFQGGGPLPWKEFAWTDSNVASATRLQGTYSIWGQSFYGNDISGALALGSAAIYGNKWHLRDDTIGTNCGAIFGDRYGNAYAHIAYYHDHFYICHYKGGSVEGAGICLYDDGHVKLDYATMIHTGDATLKMYGIISGEHTSYGKETMAIQTAFDGVDPESHEYPRTYSSRCQLALQPRGGRVAIGKEYAICALDVNGNILAAGEVTATNVSDRALKRHIEAAGGAVATLRGLGGYYTFDYTEAAGVEQPQGRLGLIYQNVTGHWRDLMGLTRPDGYGALNYIKPDYINLIGAGVLECASAIESLDERVKVLEERA